MMINLRRLFCLFNAKSLMLAGSVRSIDQLLKFAKNFNQPHLVEHKFDGMRIQIHFSKSMEQTKIFSRSSEDQSSMIPDLIQLANKTLMQSQYEQCILDGELMCVQKKTGNFISFTKLMARRGKKRSEADFNKTDFYQQFMIFDILRKNGKMLLETPLIQRKKELLNLPPPFQNVSYISTNCMDQIQKQFQLSRALKLEGLIVKKAKSLYSGNSRTFWAKIKQDLFQSDNSYSFKDIDLAVIGGYFGKGKNSTVLSSFLLGLLYQKKFISISKVGSGFTSQFLRQLTRRSESDKSDEYQVFYQGYKTKTIQKPDRFFQPYLIWKIKYQEISLSSTYKLGKAGNSENRGLSLRFPIFIAERPDLSIKDIKTGQEIIRQSQIK